LRTSMSLVFNMPAFDVIDRRTVAMANNMASVRTVELT
jgi:hypothetical protein